MKPDPLARVRDLCLALPEANERLSHGEPCFFIRSKNCFVMFANNHHDDGRVAIWCAAPLGAQAAHVERSPRQFFVPPYVGYRGWVGVRLDLAPDWKQVAQVIEDAYRTVAPRKMLAALDAR